MGSISTKKSNRAEQLVSPKIELRLISGFDMPWIFGMAHSVNANLKL